MVDFEDEETQLGPPPKMMVTPTIELLRPLGRGGMGHVWVAHHHGLRTDVVVKFMAEHLASDPEASSRFSREAAAASQVKSPHVVQVFDHGVAADGRLYIAMELLEGSDLAGVLAQRRMLEFHEVTAIVSQVSRALAKAHERGIVHRDIKPENIFLLDAGGGELFAKVLDFGIAKSVLSTVGRGTATGAMVGTPYYMAPEQIMGARSITQSADLWSLGVVAFEMLTGTQPFFGETVGAISVAICSSPLPQPTARNPRLPAAVDAWFMRACAREEGQRFQSATELADGLKAALHQAPSTAAVPMTAAGTPRVREATTSGGTTAASLPPAEPAASSRPRWLLPSALGLLVVVGGLTGIVASTLSRTHEVPEAEDHPKKASAKKSKATAEEEPAEKSATPTPTSEIVDSAPSSSTDPAAKSAPSPKASAPGAAKVKPPASASTGSPSVPSAQPTAKKKNVVLE